MNPLIYIHDDSPLAKEVWQLYESAFPIEERRALQQHVSAMQDSRFYPYTYVSGQSELLAICFCWNFTDFKYLEHFAVHPNCRNKGIGSQIIQTLNTDKKPVILEIEPPVDTLTKQRLNFYKRNRFYHTGYRFKQLKYRKNTAHLQLELLCNKKMNSNLYKRFKETIYQELTPYNEV